MPAEGNFGKVFRMTMAASGMPWPEAIGDDFEKVVNVAGQLIAARAIGTETSAIRALFVNLPKAVATGTGASAASATAIVSVAGAYAAAYIGAVLGSLLVATWDTYGPMSLGKLQKLVRDTEHAFGREFSAVVVGMIMPSPYLNGAEMVNAMHVARALTPARPRPDFRATGGRGGGGTGGRGGSW